MFCMWHGRVCFARLPWELMLQMHALFDTVFFKNKMLEGICTLYVEMH